MSLLFSGGQVEGLASFTDSPEVIERERAEVAACVEAVKRACQ